MKTLIIVATFFACLSFYLFTELEVLKREKEAYDWRNFTCKTLLDDPVTKQIYCPNHKIVRMK